jgi:hypothetical protein
MAFATPFALIAIQASQRVAALAPDYEETPYAEAPSLILAGAQMLGLLATWGMSILALGLAVRALSATRQFAALLVAYNWSQLLTLAVAAFPYAIVALMGGSSQFAVLLVLPALIFSYVVLWNVLRRNLPITIGVTISLLALLELLGLAVNYSTTQGVIALFQLLS